MKLKLRTGLLAVLGIMLIFSVPLKANTEEETVEFKDRNLELAIREEIGKATGDIYTSDLKNLTNLFVPLSQVSDLTGISECKYLEKIRLDFGSISNLAPLAKLTNLRSLRLIKHKITDISPLSKLTNLHTLILSHNEISDISPLSKLTNLHTLSLNINEISDISPLSKLTNLRSLALSYNKITDITPLKKLRKLEWLRLEENNISDLQPLIENSNPEKENNNKGLGKGDKIFIHQNQLNLTEGSEDLQDIQTLMDRGVKVEYYPQK